MLPRRSVFAAIAMALTSSPALAQSPTVETGVLECTGEGGWGMILGSQKTMRCTFSSLSGKPLEFYNATITKYGLDIGATGQTAMVWAVFAPASAAGGNYASGSLEGDYVGVSAEASAGLGVGSDALVGGGPTSFALQPISAKAQTGLNLAVGVENFDLSYVEPAR